MALDDIRKNFDEGVDRLKWYAQVLSERVRAEISVIGLMRQAQDLERHKATLMAEMGKRMYELRKSPTVNLAEDRDLSSLVREIEELEARIAEIRQRVQEVGSGEGEE